MEPKSNIEQDVKLIQIWLETQPHLPKITDSQIRLFLHSCYQNIEEAKTTIDNYFTFKTENPELFAFPQSERKLDQTLDSIFVGYLPKLTPDGCLIGLFKITDPRAEKYNFSDQINQFFLALMSYLLQNDPVNGLVVVFDAEHFSLGHLLKISMGLLRKMLYCIQEALPVRLKAIHVVNSNSIASKLIKISRPFLKREIYEMIQFHTSSNLENFYKSVPKQHLIKEHGGCLPSYLDIKKAHKRNIKANKKFFDWHSSQIVEEYKRPRKNGYFNGLWRKFGF